MMLVSENVTSVVTFIIKSKVMVITDSISNPLQFAADYYNILCVESKVPAVLLSIKNYIVTVHAKTN